MAALAAFTMVRDCARGPCRYAGLVRDLAARRASEQQAQLATAAERATSAAAALRQVRSRHVYVLQVPAGVRHTSSALWA